MCRDPDSSSQRTAKLSHLPGGLVALAFLVIGLFTLQDYGFTNDEGFTYHAARSNLQVVQALLQGRIEPQWLGHDLRGYYFVLDTVRGAIAELVMLCSGTTSYIEAFHLANLTLAALSIYVLFAIALQLTGDARIGTFAALTLALFPGFIAHSQNNPKDLIALFAFTQGIYCILRASQVRTWSAWAVGGVSLGLLLTSTTLGVLVVPILAIWLAVQSPRQTLGDWKGFLLLGLVGGVCALLFWPWLWDDPVRKLLASIEYVTTFSWTTQELHLGTTHSAQSLPWHYFIVNFIAAAPLSLLILALASPLAWSRLRAADPRLRRMALLAWLWFVIPLVVEANAPSRYGVLRHFLLTLPGFALACGVGAELLYRTLLASGRVQRFRVSSLGAAAIVGILFVDVLIADIRMHPYQGAFLNRITNALIPGEAQQYFLLEYFGHQYKEGSEWLNANAEPNAQVFVPINPHVASKTLGYSPSKGTIEQFLDTSRPRYLMFITRVTSYTDLIRFADERYEPVFSIRRQKATLLKIIKNRRDRDG